MAEPALTLPERLEVAAGLPGGAGVTFTVGGVEDVVPWAALLDEAQAMAAALQARGVAPGTHVALLGPTTRPLATAIEAVWLCGATLVILPLPMRLGSIEDQRREMADAPEAGEHGSVEDVLDELGVDYSAFQEWGDAFLAAINRVGDEPFPDLFARIPRPPDEPAALWERLLLLAHTPGPAGLSACLILHTLACARAVRSLKLR